MNASPVVHIVLARWKAGFGEPDLQELTAAVGDLADHIPGILAVHSGASTSPEGLEAGFEWALVITFADGAARDRYLPHPAHEPVKQLISAWADQVVVFDLDT